jgi:hypothetical protein
MDSQLVKSSSKRRKGKEVFKIWRHHGRINQRGEGWLYIRYVMLGSLTRGPAPAAPSSDCLSAPFPSSTAHPSQSGPHTQYRALSFFLFHFSRPTNAYEESAIFGTPFFPLPNVSPPDSGHLLLSPLKLHRFLMIT